MKQLADLDRLLVHADWLHALARRLVGTGDADDVVQETFIAALRTPPDSERSPRPWLARVLANVTRMQFRRDTRRARREDAAAITARDALTPGDIVQRVEMQRTLCELVLALDEPYRRTLVQHYFDDMSLAEIARADSVAEGTVRWRHRQALEYMRVRLDERAGGDRKAWVAALAPITAPTTPTTALAGGLLMKKLAIVTILVLAGGIVAWRVSAHEATRSRTASTRTSAAHLQFGERPPMITGGTHGSIHGRVLASDANVEVALLAVDVNDVPSLLARRTGPRFDFRGLGPGRYCVVANSGPLGGSACDLELGEGTRIERDVRLADGEARLRGKVSDADGGVISEPLVVVQRVPDGEIVSAVRGDSVGRYDLALAAGWYRVTAEGDGYTMALQLVEVLGEVQLDLHLNAAATVCGTVVDVHGDPVRGAAVALISARGSTRTTTTGVDGRFAITGLRPGHFEIMASAGERVARLRPIVLTFAATEEIELVVDATRSAIEGQVVDEAGGAVVGATIEIRGPLSRAVKSDERGTFRIGGVVSGTYAVAASADGFVRASTEKIVGDGVTSVKIRVAHGVTVSGRVITASGAPVPGARIASSASNLRDSRLDARSNSGGEFRIGPLPAGNVHLSAFHPEHGVSELASVYLPPGSSPTAELVFRLSSSITGRVLADDGKPASNALVTVAPAAAPARWTLAADRDGRFMLSSLPAGKYRVEAAPSTAAAMQTVADLGSSTYVVLARDMTTQVELRVAGGAERIHGRVIDAHGPVAGAAVWVERDAGFLVSPASPDDVHTYTWSDGRFELANIPRGTYTVYASHPRLGTGKVAKVPAGTRGVAIELERFASISGRVTTAEGKPPPVFRVQWTWVTRESGEGQSSARSTRMFDAADGRFTIENLEPTRLISVSVETPDGASGAAAGFALAAGVHEANLEIPLDRLGTVRGRIIDKVTRKPGLGLYVFFPTPASRGRFPVDGDGRFEANVPAGDYAGIHIQSELGGYPDVDFEFAVKSGQSTDLGDVGVTLEQ